MLQNCFNIIEVEKLIKTTQPARLCVCVCTKVFIFAGDL